MLGQEPSSRIDYEDDTLYQDTDACFTLDSRRRTSSFPLPAQKRPLLAMDDATNLYQSGLPFEPDHAPQVPVDIKTYPIKDPAQIQMMSKIIEALEKEQHAVLESPTGSGKSLALLCGALAWVGKEAERRTQQAMDLSDISMDGTTNILPRIYVGSRTHKQVSQLVNELKGRTPYRPKMTVLGSREHYCIHPTVSKSENKAEDCTVLAESGSCLFRTHTDDLVGDPRLRRGGSKEIWDIEDLNLLGHQVGGCPYFASRDIAETAELIVCPYNYLVDPIIRKVMNIDTTGNIIILDEAHNIEGVCRDAGSFEVDDLTLRMIASELEQIIQNSILVSVHMKLLELIRYLMDWMYLDSHTFDIQEDSRDLCVWSPGDEIKTILQTHFEINQTHLERTLTTAFGIASDHADKQKTQKRNDSQEEPQDEVMFRTHLSVASLNMFEKLFMVLGYILDPSKPYSEDYHLVLMKNISVSDRRWERRMGLWCMNPGVIFQDIAQKAHSVILTSGTLTPVNTFEAELGIQFPITLEANHVIKPSQVMVRNIPYGPSGRSLKGVYATTSTVEYQDDIGEAIARICEAVPYGVLVFFTSYSLLDRVYKHWKATGLLKRIMHRKHILQEPRSGSSDTFNQTLEKFYRHIREAEATPGSMDGAMFLAVYRGKVSEGIDFNNNNCRAVVATGIPYPLWTDTKVKLKRSYNDERARQSDQVLTGDQWYTIQAFRAINQALGRCIRHRNDWGAILLLEQRFMDRRNVVNLSKWIRTLCVPRTEGYDTIMDDLASFAQSRLAIDTEEATSQQGQSQPLDQSQGQQDQKRQHQQDQSQEQQDQKQQPLDQYHQELDQSHQQLDQEQPDWLEQQDQSHQQPHLNQIEQPPQPQLNLTQQPMGQLDQKLPPDQQSRYVVSCKRCPNSRLLTAPFEPFALRSRSTFLHYFYTIAQSKTIEKPTTVLETHAPPLPSTVVHTDVHWDSLDKVVYKPFVSPCCQQTLGAHILTTTLDANDVQKSQIGKLWLIKALVEVVLM